ncbi:hypothetical protein FRB97_000999 [Tulasnella sp. 331]|nr:hypothetical protein FRB97_000999 [Tulasnella sp. 331]
MAPDAFEPVKDSKVTIGTLMATNHIGTFVFTNILLPLIKKTAAEPGSDVRVVTVSSFVHSSSPKTDWKTFEEWNPKPKGFLADLKPYGRSKLANILFAKQLQRNFDDEHVNALSICVAPGSIDTDTVRVGLQERSWFAYIIYHLTNLSGNFITPAQGAYTTLFAATSLVVVSSDESKGKYAASYLVPFGLVAQPTAAARDPDAARDLWATSERVVEAM